VGKEAKMLGRLFVVAALVTLALGQMTNLNCAVVVPMNALTATGLATPYLLQAQNPADGPCNMANANQQSFVQGLILDMSTGNLFVYNPLVIDAGTTPAITPTAPVLPVNNVVALWFGSNANTLQLLPGSATIPNSLQQANCVNGVLNGNMTDMFGQVSYCNAPSFFLSARQLISAGMIKVPPLGTAKDGQPCVTTRDFSLVDQDQSDNDVTTYLLVTTATMVNEVAVAAGTTAQNTAANRALLGTNAMVIANGSDEGLLILIDDAIGCTPWMAPDLADASNPVGAVGLNELHALYNQAQPMAQTPPNDPMVTTNGQQNIVKVNAYRMGVAQAGVTTLEMWNPLYYCQALATVAPPRFTTLRQFLILAASPFPTLAPTLWGFMVQRYVTSFGAGGLNCQGLLGIPSPITQVFNAQGLTTDAIITPVGNIISPTAFTPGNQFSASASTVNPAGTTAGTVSSTVAIGLGVALGVVLLIDFIVLVYYLVSLCKGRSSSGGAQYNPSYEKPVGGSISSPTDQRQSMFMRMRQWV